jgi:hypothetical protein
MDWNKVKQYGLLGVIVALLALVVWGAISKSQSEKELVRLRNEVALRDQTIEVQSGVFTRLTLESNDLRKLLDTKDEQIKGLVEQVKKNKEDLLTANQLVVKWKKAFEGAANAKQDPVRPEDPSQPGRIRVSFEKDWGMIAVKGYTVTDPPEAWVSVRQLRPLRITVAVSQDKTGAWRTYATSSEEDVGVDVALSAVNPYVLEPKWYENIQVGMAVAGGSGGGQFGLLAGVDATYRVGQFDVGPAAFLTFGGGSGITPFVGAKLNWRPFQK